MDAAGETVKYGMNGVIYANLFLQVFMSVSMQLMWGMVSTLQVFVNMPLLNVTYPANAEMVSTLIVDLVNFKLIPTDKI